MPELAFEFEVYCPCGTGLCNQTIEGRTPGRGMPFITVEPCSDCIARARDEGYSEGYDVGYKENDDESGN